MINETTANDFGNQSVVTIMAESRNIEFSNSVATERIDEGNCRR